VETPKGSLTNCLAARLLVAACVALIGACGGGSGGGSRAQMRTLKDYIRSNGQVLRKRHQGRYTTYIVQSDSLYRPMFRKLVVDRDCACVVQEDAVDQSARECRTNNQPVECADFKSDPDLWTYINWM
jgi:hypothetical protein